MKIRANKTRKYKNLLAIAWSRYGDYHLTINNHFQRITKIAAIREYFLLERFLQEIFSNTRKPK